MKKPLLLLLLSFLAVLCGCNEGKNVLIDRVDLTVAATPAAA